ncbi:hypothetical protein RJD24_11460 [Bacillaceae bacterium IKA-2]|nr:hypothetical protein RJD24_11460 [Bacillaceae bacterium IKA-2]
MSFYNQFPEYIPVAQKKENAKKQIEKLRKKKPNIAPIVIEGNLIARTWWAKAWNKNLEIYADYSNRIARGRSYVRNGAVLDLQITEGVVKALVQGSDQMPYEIKITIEPFSNEKWDSMLLVCNHKIDNLEELVEGKFPKELEEIFTLKGKGLFPTKTEINFDCSCYDSAQMCKHVTASLYGIGARFDEDPILFFKLRNIDFEVLLKKTVEQKMQSLLENANKKSARTLDDKDVFNLFGV